MRITLDIHSLHMRKIQASLLLCALVFASSLTCARAADDTTSSRAPVAAIADHTIKVSTLAGNGVFPLYLSADWTRPLPGITRALLVFHGKLRNAEVYNRSGLKAIKHAGAAAGGTLLITPQFLEEVDALAYRLPPDVLRWGPAQWMSGANALNAPISSFDAIDAILARLSDRAIFPNLKTVILAGHSGGGQVVQRYAVVGRAGDQLSRAGVHVRYVVANPSSYLYFSPERPVLDARGAFSFALPKRSCYGRYDLWKYGMHEPPPYVGEADFHQIEARYVRRDVIYLLGTDDTDPNHPALDKSCSGEDEGPYRFFRGKAYFAYLLSRHPEMAHANAAQQLWFVPGVEHDGDKMLNSPCGLAALFDVHPCATRNVHPQP